MIKFKDRVFIKIISLCNPTEMKWKLWIINFTKIAFLESCLLGTNLISPLCGTPEKGILNWSISKKKWRKRVKNSAYGHLSGFLLH